MKIWRGQPIRDQFISGYGVLNRALNRLNDTDDPEEADVHLYVCPPYNFPKEPHPNKMQVGLTLTERPKLKTYGFPYVEQAKVMDLLITATPWQKSVMKQHGLGPVEQTWLGHNHQEWFSPIRRTGPNTRAMAMDRGRDNTGTTNILTHYFQQVELVDSSPRRFKEISSNPEIYNANYQYSAEEIRAKYIDADVFFKWSREGWCLPILEAMSAGCLIITNCWHLDYLKHGENALIFRNVPELHACLKQAVAEPLTELKRAGQETAASLTWEKAADNIRTLIEKHYK